ncbi:MAG: hypothetical protein AABY32_02265 [Nanoarchaeota archaeon]
MWYKRFQGTIEMSIPEEETGQYIDENLIPRQSDADNTESENADQYGLERELNKLRGVKRQLKRKI